MSAGLPHPVDFSRESAQRGHCWNKHPLRTILRHDSAGDYGGKRLSLIHISAGLLSTRERNCSSASSRSLICLSSSSTCAIVIRRLRIISEIKSPVPTNPAELKSKRITASFSGKLLNASCRTAQTSATPVSYTHLDVYKRQVDCSGVSL